jgi:hypothetical protein
MRGAERKPNRLRAYYGDWRTSPQRMRQASPTIAFAVLGQVRADETLSPEAESLLVSELLTSWALRSTLNTSAIQAMLSQRGERQFPSQPAVGVLGSRQVASAFSVSNGME